MAFDPIKGDRITLYFVRAREWLGENGSLKLGVLLFLLFFGSVSLISSFEGLFFRSSSSDAKVTFIKDIAAPVQFGLLNPLVIVLILIHYRHLTEILRGVDKFVDVDQSQKNALIARMQGRYASKWTLLVAALISILGTAMVFFIRSKTDNPYYFVNGWLSFSGMLTGIWGILVTYVIAVWAIKNFITVTVLRETFVYPIKYQVLHTDRQAGLGEIGTLFTSLAGITFIAGLTLSMFLVPILLHSHDSTASRTNILLGLPYIFPYLILPLFAYLISVWDIHLKMKAGKEDILRRIATNQSMDNCKAISDFYALSKQLPEWPVNVSTIVTSIGSIGLPIASEFLRGPIKKSLNELLKNLGTG